MDDNTKFLIDANKENLDRAISFVGLMDRKANFILSVVLALTAYFVSQLGPYLDVHAKWLNGPKWIPTYFLLLDLVAVACLGCFIATAITVICAINPRTHRHSGRPSPLFFGTIAEMPIGEFKKIMKALTPEGYIDYLGDQTYDNAKIVKQKTDYVHQSIDSFWWGVSCFFVFTIFRPVLIAFIPQ